MREPASGPPAPNAAHRLRVWFPMQTRSRGTVVFMAVAILSLGSSIASAAFGPSGADAAQRDAELCQLVIAPRAATGSGPTTPPR